MTIWAKANQNGGPTQPDGSEIEQLRLPDKH